MNPKIGVYICSGCGIGECVDTLALSSLVEKEFKVPVCKVVSFACGDECVQQMQSNIETDDINRLVIAGCSGRYFASCFDFGPGLVVERVPLREFVSWTVEGEEETKQEATEDYLRMAITKVQNSEPAEPELLEMSRIVMVVGGGIAGMNAALVSAEAGYETVLIEKDTDLGGWSKRFKAVIPQHAPYSQLAEPPHLQLVEAVTNHPKITVHLSSTIEKTEGQPGQFKVSISNGNGGVNFEAGAIVQTTGWRPYNPERLTEYGYGLSKNVVTNIQIEEMMLNGRITKPSDDTIPENVAIIHCAGSRDSDHLAYCSDICCRVALKQALYIRELMPETNVYLLYKDIRTPGIYERFYAKVQEEEGVFLCRGEVVEVKEKPDGGLTITLEETLLGENIAIDADMLVLATGMVPSTLVESENGEVVEEEPEPNVDGSEETESADDKTGATAPVGAKILNLTYRLGTDLPELRYGFPDSDYICFPYETRRTGIYAAGAVRNPMDFTTAGNDGMGAALKAIQAIEAVARGYSLHPRFGDVDKPDFFMQRCTECKRCTEECPFGTLDEDEKGTPLPNPLRCRRCGICMGACPERVITFKDYSPNMILQMIKAISMPDEFDEKPRILIFMCENDAIPAMDIAAYHRHQISPWVRIIPVRCIGSVNTVFIADSLSAGFDGILLLGCKRGDKNQCHNTKGSDLAFNRMENVQEKLKQLVLESERVQIKEIQLSDWNSITGIINDFVEEIDTIGVNPYKDF